jgi:hypothetical protein
MNDTQPISRYVGFIEWARTDMANAKNSGFRFVTYRGILPSDVEGIADHFRNDGGMKVMHYPNGRELDWCQILIEVDDDISKSE